MNIKRFTLLELLIVIAIIAILASLLLPSLNKAKAKANEIACTGNLKQLGATIHLYAGDSNDFTPVSVHWGANYSADKFENYNWYANPLLMSYIGWKEGISFSNPLPYLSVRFCPSEKDPWGDAAGNKTLSYAINIYFGYGWYHRRTRITEFKTPGQTFSFADASRYTAAAFSDTAVGYENLDYRHSNSMNCSYLDGHVSRVAYVNQPPPTTPGNPFWGKFY